ncbi:heavy-metal-associated domain-containing protein [Aureibaculum luteum]|uniref:heavy-metal-associated domain-containing protein n=1 Tax=Aureibaculum luteum TaxID=1548456 RepID=UPI000E54309E|nr:metal transporter [Aureibaculum luteum]
MKKLILILVAIMAISVSAEAQSKTSKVTFEVDGVCEMCKERIEKAAILTKGVKFATWNIQKKELYCIYNNKKTTLTKIKQAIADVGHDTKEIKATDEVYDGIDECCKYRTLETH